MNVPAKRAEVQPAKDNWAAFNIPGMSLSLSVGDRAVAMREYRVLGRSFLPGQRARVTVHIERGRPIYGFEIRKDGNIKLKEMDTAADGECTVGRNVMIFSGGDQKWCNTHHDQNHFMLLELETFGKVAIYEVSLVSQSGKFFLTVSPYRSACCYRNGNAITIPTFEKQWRQLADTIRKLAPGVVEIENLDSVFDAEDDNDSDVTGEELSPGVGRVIWWSCANGTGAIATSDGNARAYWRNVEPRDGFVYLVPGEVVAYERIVLPEPGYRETTFKREVFGITAF